MPSSQPVGIVTGGASGIGLALTHNLLARNFKVCIADFNASAGSAVAQELGANVLFIQCDVSDYRQQQAVFARAFVWGGRRLDFLAANAGIDDRQSLYEDNETMKTETLAVPDGQGNDVELDVPLEFNLQTIRVDLDAVLQGIWLFKYFNRISEKPAGEKRGGKVVVTSSSAGIYSIETNPLYGAAKHALIGVVRSAAQILLSKDNITLNAICPAFVITNLCPPFARDSFPREHITPMETVMRAYDCFLDDRLEGELSEPQDQSRGSKEEGEGERSEQSKGKQRTPVTGQTVECTLSELHFRQMPEWANESQRWMGMGSDGFWERAYKGNVKGVEIKEGIGH